MVIQKVRLICDLSPNLGNKYIKLSKVLNFKANRMFTFKPQNSDIRAKQLIKCCCSPVSVSI
jgi:hypothetical protein